MGDKAPRKHAQHRIMELSPDERRDREKVNEAVRRYRESQKCST
jgi:hypothetical protein